MELRHLRYFLATAREGSMTRAAAASHVSQPALSRQLSDLERELGCELFVRESRGVTLTDEGLLLKKRAEEILALADRAEQELRTDAGEVEGDIWIGAGESRAMELVARVVAQLSRTYPGVRVNVHSGNFDDVAERVDKGLLDFGVIMRGAALDDRFASIELPWRDRRGVLMRRDHPLAGRTSITLDDLAGERLILSAQSHEALIQAPQGQDARGMRSATREDLQGRGVDVVATYTLLYNASLLVEQGVGVAICFDGIVAAGEHTPFAFVPLADVDDVPTRLMWKRFQPQSRACQQFLRVLAEQCRAK